jgi:hypothetical protein
VLVKILVARIKCHRPDLRKLHPRLRTGRLIGHIKLSTQTVQVDDVLLGFIMMNFLV